MARLKDIIGSMMRDFVSAQHEADLFAMKLYSSCRSQKQSSSLAPTSVCLGQVEMTLHCVFTGKESATADKVIDHLAVMRLIRDVSDSAPEAVLECAVSAADGTGDNPVLQMHRDQARRGDFLSFLRQSIYSHLKRHNGDFIGMDGQVDRESLVENILYVADDRFISHPELQDVFGSNGLTSLSGQLGKAVSGAIGAVVDKALEGAVLTREESCVSAEVSVSAEDLSSATEASIQTLKLTLGSRSLFQDNDV